MHNIQYNCNTDKMPLWYTTRGHDSRARGGRVTEVSPADRDDEQAGILGQGSQFAGEDHVERLDASTRRTSFQHPVSPARVIPRRRETSRLAGSQRHDYEDNIATREYDMATWRMYFRIMDHRAAKSLSSSSSNEQEDRGGVPAGGVPIVVSLSDEDSWSMDTSDRSDSSALVQSRNYGGITYGIPMMRMMMVPRRPTHISIEEREEEEQEEETVLLQFDNDEEDEGIFQFDL